MIDSTEGCNALCNDNSFQCYYTTHGYCSLYIPLICKGQQQSITSEVLCNVVIRI